MRIFIADQLKIGGLDKRTTLKKRNFAGEREIKV
jgi:hypothetical protein